MPGEDDDERPLAYEDTSGEEDASDDEKRKNEDNSSDDETNKKHPTEKDETDTDVDYVLEAIGDLRTCCLQRIERLAEIKLGYVGVFSRDVASGDLLCIMSGTTHIGAEEGGWSLLFRGDVFCLWTRQWIPISQLIGEQDARTETVEIW